MCDTPVLRFFPVRICECPGFRQQGRFWYPYNSYGDVQKLKLIYPYVLSEITRLILIAFLTILYPWSMECCLLVFCSPFWTPCTAATKKTVIYDIFERLRVSWARNSTRRIIPHLSPEPGLLRVADVVIKSWGCLRCIVTTLVVYEWGRKTCKVVILLLVLKPPNATIQDQLNPPKNRRKKGLKHAFYYVFSCSNLTVSWFSWLWVVWHPSVAGWMIDFNPTKVGKREHDVLVTFLFLANISFQVPKGCWSIPNLLSLWLIQVVELRLAHGRR